LLGHLQQYACALRGFATGEQQVMHHMELIEVGKIQPLT
jgi:hypothetical protein